jgi:hypothetical protein
MAMAMIEGTTRRKAIIRSRVIGARLRGAVVVATSVATGSWETVIEAPKEAWLYKKPGF